MDDIINHEAIEELANNLKEYFNKLGEILSELAEKIGEIIGAIKKEANKPKFMPVKSLIKPYKQPFIKVRYRARANL